MTPSFIGGPSFLADVTNSNTVSTIITNICTPKKSNQTPNKIKIQRKNIVYDILDHFLTFHKLPAWRAPARVGVHMTGEMGGGWRYGWEEVGWGLTAGYACCQLATSSRRNVVIREVRRHCLLASSRSSVSIANNRRQDS